MLRRAQHDNTRQYQAHALSDRQVVLLRLHGNGEGPHAQWKVDEVQCMTVDQASPWNSADDVVEYLTRCIVAE